MMQYLHLKFVDKLSWSKNTLLLQNMKVHYHIHKNKLHPFLNWWVKSTPHM